MQRVAATQLLMGVSQAGGALHVLGLDCFDNYYPVPATSRNMKRWTLPVRVLGNASTKTM